MNALLEKISQIGIVPVAALEDVGQAVEVAKALFAGGIPLIEVTLRTDAALQCIEAIIKNVPEVLIGVGTVHTKGQAENAVKAGAQFIVTPGFNEEVVAWCVENKVPIIPGVVSPSDLERAMQFGIEVCKFFPAETYGGVKALKALYAPYKDMKFMATGGINQTNMLAYLKLPNVLAVGGSFMLPEACIKTANWEGITKICIDTIRQILGFELAHIGIHTEDAEESKQVAHKLARLFIQEVKESPEAYFVGDMAEVVKRKLTGEKGHLAIATHNMNRAIAYLHSISVEIDKTTEMYNEKGELEVVYLKEEVGGFAIALKRK